MWSTPTLPLLPEPLLSGLMITFWIPTIDQIDLLLIYLKENNYVKNDCLSVMIVKIIQHITDQSKIGYLDL